MKTWMFFLIMITSSVLVWAKDEKTSEDVYFKTFCEWEDSSISAVKGELKLADQLLPNVPPEEKSYLEREREWIFNNRAAVNWYAHYQSIRERPYYYVWETRQELARLMTAMNDIRELDSLPTSSGRDAVKVTKLISMLGALPSYSLSIKELIDNTTTQYLRLSSSTNTLSSSLQTFTLCQISKFASH